MMNYPKVSIVIPSFNQGRYIEQTITSIIDQQYSSLELIVIDGGSQDNTVNILKKYNKHITYWVSEPDRGQAHAINKGLAIATGEIFNWINSDDYLEPGALYAIGKFFNKNPDKTVLCGYTRCFYDEDNSTSHIYIMGIRSNATETILNLEMNQPGTFYKTTVLRALGGVNESLRYVFDNELWIRYLGKYGVSGVSKTDELFAQFRLHGSSKSVGEGFHKFQLEQNAINYDIAERLSLPTYLLNEMCKEESVTYYKPTGIVLTHINRRAYLAFYSLKYLSKWYHSGNYNKVKIGICNVFRNNITYYPLNRKYISILVKSLFN